jgi:hypothetical protein
MQNPGKEIGMSFLGGKPGTQSFFSSTKSRNFFQNDLMMGLFFRRDKMLLSAKMILGGNYFAAQDDLPGEKGDPIKLFFRVGEGYILYRATSAGDLPV